MFWHPFRCKVGAEHSVGGNLQDLVVSALSGRHAAQLSVVPETAGWAAAGPVPGQVGTFHFLNDSVEGQGNHWSSRLSPGSARWVILIHDVYLQVQLSSPAILKQSGLWVQDAWRARVGEVICDPLLEFL